MANEIANTIKDQIGCKALFLLGASQIVARENGLQFAIRGSRKVNKVVVVLDPSDTYTVEFWKMTKMTFTKKGELKGGPVLVSSHENVYVDSLHTLIESETGLYTSL